MPRLQDQERHAQTETGWGGLPVKQEDTMSRNKDSLKHQLRTAALSNITDNDSKRAYRRAVDAFSVWAKGQGIKDLSAVSADVIQRYEEYLEGRPEQYTAATIHAKLAPVCKAVGVNMAEIRKPKRTAGRIKRGRSDAKRGAHEATLPKYARLVMLQKCLGIRRAELSRLTGDCLIRDDRGRMYIKVVGGKGGKSQNQFVLPKDRETVAEIFAGIAPEQRVFTDEEMKNHINLHRLRAEHAKECYQYYVQALEKHPETAHKALRASLLRRWENGHAEMKERAPEAYSKARKRFIEDMDDRPYMLRGENRKKAEQLGLPTTYNRLALMAVSVYHLSHWRLDVTSVNYLVQ